MDRDVSGFDRSCGPELYQGKADRSLDYISPLPTFNYGSVPTVMGLDGDPLDALVLGPRLPRGTNIETTVQTVALIVDAGLIDDKLIGKTPAVLG